MSSPQLSLPLVGPRIRIESGPAGQPLRIVRLGDGAPIGEAALEVSAGTLTIQSLCIEEPYRSYGAGSEAGRLLVHAAAASGFHLLRAWAPPDRGLATYFWFRMGLRPLHGEGPNGGLSLERTLSPKS